MKVSDISSTKASERTSSSSETSFFRQTTTYVWNQVLRREREQVEEVVDNVNALEQFIAFTLEQRNFSRVRKSEYSHNFFDRFVEYLTDSPIALVGAGKMGTSILESWLALGLRREWIVVVEPKPSAEIIEITTRKQIEIISDIRQLRPVSVLFLAIKPQEADQVLHYFRHFIGNKTLVISIMAGKSLSFISQKIERRAAIVRAMPNLAATVGKSTTAAIANDLAEDHHCKIAFALLRATGTVHWIKEEPWMDAITAVSGSGPAYVFLLAEELAKAGIEAGLPIDLANQLARETVVGSGELLHQSKLDSATLRKNVTSPGGTTAAALEVLMKANGMHSLLAEAVAAATARSKELAK